MRLWSLHPKYLDAKGLVALWREALLAQAVLKGETKGYRHHPQLNRFRSVASPVRAIAAYLRAVNAEATRRGYRFDGKKIGRGGSVRRIAATRGQLDYEWKHLRAKLQLRDPARLAALRSMKRPGPHPLFRVVPGGVADWEVVRKKP
ncbi:MAG TPA: pyrimidine dimer DNA glycosylase/endonuclease V [Burkholderiales bacterium]|nr:pyrimidine dimer DNA glycosylase/endonuclease V [Burkholderiales bacterium]